MATGDQVDPITGSHPLIRYERPPIVLGPMGRFEGQRTDILSDVVSRTQSEFKDGDIELLLSESSFLELARVKKNLKFSSSLPFTLGRHLGDRRLWRSIRNQLKKGSERDNQLELLERALSHYAEEIGGHFNPRVYWLAVRVVPFFFSWLLNAASVKKFLPFSLTESLQSRIHIVGEVDHLQKISKKGTILLVPTHQSNLDSPLVGYIIYLMGLPPFAYGAGLNLFTNPLLSFFMSSLGAYTVDRQKSGSLYKETLKAYSASILERGLHSIFFPGGGRSRNGALESHLKLGLLGTGLQANLYNLQNNRPNPNVYVVPMVVSYHFVLEASSLIEQAMQIQGNHRYWGADTEDPAPFVKTMKFFWKFFAKKTAVTARVGRPMDIFGNDVDEEGRSIGPNGTTIDPASWLSTGGRLKADAQRDQEYTKELGRQIVNRYYRGNTVLTSHVVAFAYFMGLRRRYADLDVYRFLLLSPQQRRVQYSDFEKDCEDLLRRLKDMANNGELFLSPELQTLSRTSWVEDGIKNLGLFHSAKVLRKEGDSITTDDLPLLYYYRNRLSGYGLSIYGDEGARRMGPGDYDRHGFLA